MLFLCLSTRTEIGRTPPGLDAVPVTIVTIPNYYALLRIITIVTIPNYHALLRIITIVTIPNYGWIPKPKELNERLVEYCWSRIIWNLEFDETVPPAFYAHTSKLRPVKGLLSDSVVSATAVVLPKIPEFSVERLDKIINW